MCALRPIVPLSTCHSRGTCPRESGEWGARIHIVVVCGSAQPITDALLYFIPHLSNDIPPRFT